MNITVTLTATPELLVALLELSDALKGKGIAYPQVVNIPRAMPESKAEVKAEVKTEEPKKEIVQAVQPEAPKGEDTPPWEGKKEEDPKVTKEMIRERLGAIMKAGKQNEVKALVAKYGASKVPDLKEEDYVAIYKEAEGLL